MKLTPSLLSKHEEPVMALRELKLPTIVQEFTAIAKDAEKHKLTYEQYLFKLLETELQVRRYNRVKKLLREAKLPLTKTLEQSKRLDRFDLLVCDELGYTPHDQDGADLFFQLISQRAERKSIVITTNLTYSEWDKVFLNPLATAAAVIVGNNKTSPFLVVA